ncbi:sulfotransferase family 2 domain-containing protein [Paracoccus sp. SCSIO 75233]|uniref:sulfotransferase family 2 domain-containing protein n=1 Tax=Paracoccus sp. SCSIO 75233 TaxID=3017782 RepID=UPI0022F061EA|nr:sulfotransferase family 2 domain-containing protein [Paracoccus sp. SCSIO 75233]WBU53488.1 sulfotransferase family 2 domain-containing protein [Paracoccus sp. SCSIO 75233]
MRNVIVHYHIYKNSGTSFERVLDASFGERHERFDGPYPFFTIDQDQLDRVIKRRANAQAFSSHQIQLPHPTSLEYRVIAAIFLRHPILRVGSIYRFKRQENDGTDTAALAKQYDFGDFVEACFLTKGQLPHISNGQTRHLANVYCRNPVVKRQAEMMIYDIANARRNLALVELLGRTEFFEEDVRRFIPIAASFGLTLKMPEVTRHNMTEEHDASVEERVDRLLSQLSPKTRQKLIAANELDQELYDYACEIIATQKAC